MNLFYIQYVSKKRHPIPYPVRAEALTNDARLTSDCCVHWA